MEESVPCPSLGFQPCWGRYDCSQWVVWKFTGLPQPELVQSLGNQEAIREYNFPWAIAHRIQLEWLSTNAQAAPGRCDSGLWASCRWWWVHRRVRGLLWAPVKSGRWLHEDDWTQARDVVSSKDWLRVVRQNSTGCLTQTHHTAEATIATITNCIQNWDTEPLLAISLLLTKHHNMLTAEQKCWQPSPVAHCGQWGVNLDLWGNKLIGGPFLIRGDILVPKPSIGLAKKFLWIFSIASQFPPYPCVQKTFSSVKVISHLCQLRKSK